MDDEVEYVEVWAGAYSLWGRPPRPGDTWIRCRVLERFPERRQVRVQDARGRMAPITAHDKYVREEVA